ncbi:flagellin lysine-N-methylase [Clostridium ihumii]|uniref:flagellin lysine-N-methylase n=1 Tax=Clostridium ihumii TaxID=1470356 RepID=UPI003D32514D
MPKNIVLSPNYIDKFKCIGGECLDSCCIGWKVDIDKRTYQNYRVCKNMQFRKKLYKFVKRNRKSNSNKEYAKIVMDIESRRCPFLNKKNLCDVYINIGEESMSNTCTEYPRYYSKINGVLEKSLTLSCPEAARLILDNQELMNFNESLEENIKEYAISREIETNKIKIHPLEKYFWELRVIAIDIIQNRNYSMDERIILLGILSDEINKCIIDKESNNIPNIIEKYVVRINNNEYKEFLKQIPNNIDLKLKLIKGIERLKVEKGVNAEFTNIIGKALVGLGCIEGATDEEIKTKYISVKENYNHVLEKKYNYILENYLVNHIFKNTFPLTGRKNIFEEYILICVYYSIIKFNLTGLSAEKELTKEEIITFIQKFSKAIEHDSTYIDIIEQSLKDDKLNTMAYMAILIKD